MSSQQHEAKVIPITVAPRGLHGSSGKVGRKPAFIPDAPFGSEFKSFVKPKKKVGFIRRVLNKLRDL